MVGHSIISVESRCLGKAGDAVISDLSQNVNEVSDIVFTGIARNDKVWVLEVIVNALIQICVNTMVDISLQTLLYYQLPT